MDKELKEALVLIINKNKVNPELWETVEGWEKVVAAPVKKYYVPPREARRILQFFGVLSNVGCTAPKVLQLLLVALDYTILKKEEDRPWKITSPSGEVFTGSSPLRCAAAANKRAIPVEVAFKRLVKAVTSCVLCDQCKGEHILGKDTPAEIGPVCTTCKNTIITEYLGPGFISDNDHD